MSELNLPKRALLHVAVARGLDWVWPFGAAWAYKDALCWAPREPELHLRRGAALGRANRWREASRSFGAAVRLRPRSLEYQASLVVALHRAGQGDDLIAALRRLVELRPDEGELTVLLGAVLLRENRRAEALRVFRWAIRLPPGHERRRFVLGEALLGPQGWAQALASWQEARDLDPRATGGAEAPGRSVLHRHPGRRRVRTSRPEASPRGPGLGPRLRELWGRLGVGFERSVVCPVAGDERERRVRALRRAWRKAHPNDLRWPMVWASLRRRAPDASA